MKSIVNLTLRASLFVVALLTVCLSFNACAHDQLITFEQLPAPAQQLVKEHFADQTVAYVTKDRELFGNEYDVRFNNGAELKFDNDGSLHKVDCKFAPVPEALIPAPVLEQVKAQFPDAFIVEWGKDDWGWKAELNNKLELKFNRKFEFIGIDD